MKFSLFVVGDTTQINIIPEAEHEKQLVKMLAAVDGSQEVIIRGARLVQEMTGDHFQQRAPRAADELATCIVIRKKEEGPDPANPNTAELQKAGMLTQPTQTPNPSWGSVYAAPGGEGIEALRGSGAVERIQQELNNHPAPNPFGDFGKPVLDSKG